MKKSAAVLIVLAVALMSGETVAATYTAIGAGNMSCGTWTAWRRNRTSVGPQEWVLGFLSGIGFTNPEAVPLNGMDGEGVFAWIDNYCWAHPVKDIAVAAAAFYYEHPN